MKSILETVHESAKDLHDAGVIDDDKMEEFDEICLSTSEDAKEYIHDALLNYLNGGLD